MKTFVVLIRGINVGGRNKVPMADLKRVLAAEGYDHISTLLASGNVILRSTKAATAVTKQIQDALAREFRLDSEVAVRVLTAAELHAVVHDRPRGFGDDPTKHHSDAIFLMGLGMKAALKVFDPREGVDELWAGKGVIYHRRLSSRRTKTRLNKVMATPEYLSMTIRSWGTTLKLLKLAETVQSE